MISLWIPITFAAAFLQNLRSVLQKAIKGRLSTTGAAYARFLYAWPLGLLYVWVLTENGFELPTPNATFFIYCALGGIAQILFTVVLLWMFSFRSFAVGTTFSKLEVVLIAGLGAVLLGDSVGPLALLAIGVGAVGTVVLSLTENRLSFGAVARGMLEPATMIGLLSAAFLGASVVFFRGATLALEHPDFIMAAAFSLSIALIIQTIAMGLWFLAFDRDELSHVIREWRRAAPVGVVGMACSVCWFTAFTLQNGAYVRALGQVELLFTFIAGVFVFREKTTLSEIIGVALIFVAILLILLAA
ncbi:MAG: EamA family transporter [Pikeienuella sp.]